MPRQKNIVAENQFIGGLKTEFTGLNFPENSCIDVSDCTFHRTGLVTRRKGFEYEVNYAVSEIDRSGKAISTYWWRNAIGDGTVSLYAVQFGSRVYFYNASEATAASPLSRHLVIGFVDMEDFATTTFDETVECQYTDGNKNLFIFHPNADPVRCTFSGGVVTPAAVSVKIRDTAGISEPGVEDNYRPLTLTDIHRYNLANQGWNKAWETSSTTSNDVDTGILTFTVDEGLPIFPGDRVVAYVNGSITTSNVIGGVQSYTGNTLVIDVTTVTGSGTSITNWKIVPQPPLIDKWKDAVGNYPSNSDVWWYFKNADDEFDPENTIDNVTIAAGRAPRGFYILDAFEQDRALVSGIDGLTAVTTNGIRPSTGAWFQSRIWYAGIDAAGFNEKLYFSQIIETEDQFGKCYQVNDLTSQDRFDLLPTDGGEVSIQGTGKINKLFVMTNGMLVFADKGIWFITGNQGIGFTANDFTITKISTIESLSPYSFVEVTGVPIWWNQEGIYTVAPSQEGFKVISMTNTTIASFYQDIPLSSKYYARGYYNPITFQVQWLYRRTPELSVTTRYQYTNILNFDTQINAFYPWTIAPSNTTSINSIVVIGGNGLNDTLPFKFKYLTSSKIVGTYNITFSEERRDDYVDWRVPAVAYDYTSYIITGYRVHTQGMKKEQLPYINIYTEDSTSYLDLQARWDFTTSGDTGKWSSTQRIVFDAPDRAYQTKRRRIRGEGKAVQLKFSSVSEKPMSIVGWSTMVESTQVP